MVVTMHGTVPFSTPLEEFRDTPTAREQVKRENKMVWQDWQQFRHTVNAVVAVSHHSKSELHKHLEIPEAIIQVIHHGVDHSNFHPDTTMAEPGYFLHVSTGAPAKNLKRVLIAYSQLQLNAKPELLLVGIRRALPPLPTGVRQISPVSSQELAKLYRGALALVFPSIEESFGMPLAEAMACGCPVITSSNSACREVSAQAGLYVNPVNVLEIQQAMRSLARDPVLRHCSQQLGLERAKAFDWQETASQHAELFVSLL